MKAERRQNGGNNTVETIHKCEGNTSDFISCTARGRLKTPLLFARSLTQSGLTVSSLTRFHGDSVSVKVESLVVKSQHIEILKI